MAETPETKNTQNAVVDEEKPEKDVKNENSKKSGVNGKPDVEKNDGDGESSEEELGSLEKPVEILSRKRERKSTERFSLSSEVKPKEEDLDFTSGHGIKLGDIEFIRHSLDRTLADDLRPLHRLLFRQAGKATTIKKNIRSFCGYPFEKDTEHYQKSSNSVDKFTVSGLRFVCGLLGLEKGGDREKLKERLLDFLMEPKDLGKSIPQKKVKKKSSGKKKNKSDSKTKTDDIESSGSEDEEKETEQKQKKKSTPKKKEEKKKRPTPVKIAVPKKKEKKEKNKETKRKNTSDSEDDEPLLKKTKSEPTNEEIKKIVANILKDADLEQVTMKTVCKQVYDHFPDFDLTSRKDFIKATVKEIIS